MLTSLEWRALHEWTVTNNDSAGVLGRMARIALELHGQVYYSACHRVALVHHVQVGRLDDSLLQGRMFPLYRRRNNFSDHISFLE